MVVGGRPVRLEEVSVPRPGQSMAFVMDTGLCDGAFELAAGVDLLVCEATFAEADGTWRPATTTSPRPRRADLAAEAGARRLVITHYSQRYPDERRLRAEAAEVFGDVVAARDLLRVPGPGRHGPADPIS